MTQIDTTGPAVERLAIANDELWCDLLTLMGRASSEGHEAGQRLACEARQKVRYTGETLRALAAERDALLLAAKVRDNVDAKMDARTDSIIADRDAARAQLATLQSAVAQAVDGRSEYQQSLTTRIEQLVAGYDDATQKRDAARAEVARLLAAVDDATAALARGDDEQMIHGDLSRAAGSARAALAGDPQP